MFDKDLEFKSGGKERSSTPLHRADWETENKQGQDSGDTCVWKSEFMYVRIWLLHAQKNNGGETEKKQYSSTCFKNNKQKKINE